LYAVCLLCMRCGLGVYALCDVCVVRVMYGVRVVCFMCLVFVVCCV